MHFGELNFISGPAGIGGRVARADFKNGLSISVIRNHYSYGDEEQLYEIGMLVKERTIAVVGHMSPDEVTLVLTEFEKFAPRALNYNESYYLDFISTILKREV
jgi:hypothetical protein